MNKKRFQQQDIKKLTIWSSWPHQLKPLDKPRSVDFGSFNQSAVSRNFKSAELSKLQKIERFLDSDQNLHLIYFGLSRSKWSYQIVTNQYWPITTWSNGSTRDDGLISNHGSIEGTENCSTNATELETQKLALGWSPNSSWFLEILDQNFWLPDA